MDEAGPLGAQLDEDGVRFSVWSGAAERIWLCLFGADGAETHRVPMELGEDAVFSAFVKGIGAGQRYGFRAEGPYGPANGIWFDPQKLLVDPYALAIDRPFQYDARLAAAREGNLDTAPLVPKSLVCDLEPVSQQEPLFSPGGLIYEINVRGFSMRHPDVPEEQRGTIAALAHPAIIAHLKKLRVGAIELMPIAAWMDERHLAPLGLTNAWGYNPVTFMALDPRLAPGGWTELRQTVDALHAAGIGVILDVVFNHTAESDALGPTVSLRGLDSRAYYRHDDQGRLINDTGTGNTLDCANPATQRLVLDSLRTFVRYAGVDGFRFDLAPILGRDANGFSPDAPLLRAMLDDPEIGSRVLIAEPWDIGPGGYQLGNFPEKFLEWNDRYRDDARRYWRGDGGMVPMLATRLAGSSDIFAGEGTRTVNLIAAHDGMTLADLVAYQHKHNHANGEDNRDGHDDNLSWNHGVEGPSDRADVVEARGRSVRALLATLFLSRGAIMLTAGDEFGRTQGGNNNAYAQDNEITWLDWHGRDRALEDFVARLAEIRATHPTFAETRFLTGDDVRWLDADGTPMTAEKWNDPSRRDLTVELGDLRIVFGGGGVSIFNGEHDDHAVRTQR
jgi:glycogen operon protein